MKNKFDLLYESIMDDLKKSEVTYKLISEFEDQIKDELNHLKLTESEETIKSYLEFVYNDRIKKCHPFYKNDRLDALKDICKKVLNKNLEEIIELN